MTDTPSTAPDDETRPLGTRTIDPEPAAPPTTEWPPVPPYAGRPGPGHPGYAGQPGYPAAQRPRFSDQVLGMRAVLGVALAALVLGGLGGFLLGALTTGSDGDRFGGPGGFGRQGFGPGQSFNQGQAPNGQQNGQPNGQQNGQQNGQPNGQPNGQQNGLPNGQ